MQMQIAGAEAERQAGEAKHATRRMAAAKGELTKMKKRVGNGVCPCCNRQFVNLQRHMATQHPGYAVGNDEDAAAT